MINKKLFFILIFNFSLIASNEIFNPIKSLSLIFLSKNQKSSFKDYQSAFKACSLLDSDACCQAIFLTDEIKDQKSVVSMLCGQLKIRLDKSIEKEDFKKISDQYLCAARSCLDDQLRDQCFRLSVNVYEKIPKDDKNIFDDASYYKNIADEYILYSKCMSSGSFKISLKQMAKDLYKKAFDLIDKSILDSTISIEQKAKNLAFQAEILLKQDLPFVEKYEKSIENYKSILENSTEDKKNKINLECAKIYEICAKNLPIDRDKYLKLAFDIFSLIEKNNPNLSLEDAHSLSQFYSYYSIFNKDSGVLCNDSVLNSYFIQLQKYKVTEKVDACEIVSMLKICEIVINMLSQKIVLNFSKLQKMSEIAIAEQENLIKKQIKSHILYGNFLSILLSDKKKYKDLSSNLALSVSVADFASNQFQSAAKLYGLLSKFQKTPKNIFYNHFKESQCYESATYVYDYVISFKNLLTSKNGRQIAQMQIGAFFLLLKSYEKIMNLPLIDSFIKNFSSSQLKLIQKMLIYFRTVGFDCESLFESFHYSYACGILANFFNFHEKELSDILQSSVFLPSEISQDLFDEAISLRGETISSFDLLLKNMNIASSDLEKSVALKISKELFLELKRVYLKSILKLDKFKKNLFCSSDLVLQSDQSNFQFLIDSSYISTFIGKSISISQMPFDVSSCDFSNIFQDRQSIILTATFLNFLAAKKYDSKIDSESQIHALTHYYKSSYFLSFNKDFLSKDNIILSIFKDELVEIKKLEDLISTSYQKIKIDDFALFFKEDIKDFFRISSYVASIYFKNKKEFKLIIEQMISYLNNISSSYLFNLSIGISGVSFLTSIDYLQICKLKIENDSLKKCLEFYEKSSEFWIKKIGLESENRFKIYWTLEQIHSYLELIFLSTKDSDLIKRSIWIDNLKVLLKDEIFLDPICLASSLFSKKCLRLLQ